jgi:hypothetical protein
VRARALCAPVFLDSLPPERGATRPLLPANCSSIASYYFFLSTGPQRLLKYEVPCPPPPPDRSFLLFFSFSSLLFNFFFFFSSYLSLLILLLGAILRLLILLLLLFNLLPPDITSGQRLKHILGFF